MVMDYLGVGTKNYMNQISKAFGNDHVLASGRTEAMNARTMISIAVLEGVKMAEIKHELASYLASQRLSSRHIAEQLQRFDHIFLG